MESETVYPNARPADLMFDNESVSKIRDLFSLLIEIDREQREASEKKERRLSCLTQ